MVVPGIGETMDRSSPTMRLRRVDLATLGRPMMATWTGRLALVSAESSANSFSASAYSGSMSESIAGVADDATEFAASEAGTACRAAMGSWVGVVAGAPDDLNSARAASGRSSTPVPCWAGMGKMGAPIRWKTAALLTWELASTLLTATTKGFRWRGGGGRVLRRGE